MQEQANAQQVHLKENIQINSHLIELVVVCSNEDEK